jgi:2-polyprenyl-3-methyl-5-hydroxy-6-metoxy-1,4-benzoquinol methylase
MNILRDLRGIEQVQRRLRAKVDALHHMREVKRRLTRAAIPNATPRSIFGDTDDDLWWWINTAGYKALRPLQDILPALPPANVQARFTGLTGDATLADGFRIYTMIRQQAEKYRGDIRNYQHILDFGCGWGRILRFFLRDLPPTAIEGIDCMEQAIQVCRATNRWCRFTKIAPTPPTDLPHAQSDLIYAYSVFSHLSEEYHWLWLKEFHRLLKPGGLLVITTRPREFVEHAAHIRGLTARPDWTRGLDLAFVEVAATLRRYDLGEFCYSPTGGGDELAPSFYGEALIPRGYILSRWTKLFDYLDYIEDRTVCEQNVVVVRKPF